MKITKWICRYGFLVILLALAVGWYFMCQHTIDQMEKEMNSLSYIDLVLNEFDTAVEKQQEIQVFRDRQKIGIIGGAVVGGLLVLMILWNIFGNKISAFAVKTAKDIFKKPPKKKDEPKDESGYCTECGTYYEKLPSYCENCGVKIE